MKFYLKKFYILYRNITNLLFHKIFAKKIFVSNFLKLLFTRINIFLVWLSILIMKFYL